MKCQFKLLFLLFGKKVCKRCPWLVTLKGPEDKDNKRKDISNCAMAWIPVLMTETRAAIDGVSSTFASVLARPVKKVEPSKVEPKTKSEK